MPVTEHWQRWTAFLHAHLPDTARQLRPPAAAQDIADLEARIGVALPADVRELYSLNDGEADEETNPAGGCFFGLYFLPFNRMRVTGGTEPMPESTSRPADAIRPFDTHTRWFPLGHDGGGNFIGFDLDPGASGTPGQIINFGRDEVDKFVMADSLAGFLEVVMAEIDAGNYSLDDSGGYLRLQIGEYYLTDTLRHKRFGD